jgi:prepilin-type N-terminal cleavage/methylation domain-containing protein
MKKGFTMLEVMLGLAVGSLLTGMLVQSLWQLSKTLSKVNAISSVDMRALTLQNLLEKEFSGAFVPDLVPFEKEDELKKTSQSSTEPKEEKSINPPKGFYSKNDGDNLVFLTFITSNPLSVYNMIKPRVARIIYELVPDKNISGSSVLYRYESVKIMEGEKSANQEKGFVVVDGIKSIECTYLAEEKVSQKKNSNKSKENEKTQKKLEKEEQQEKKIVTLKEWDSEQYSKEKQEEKEEKMPLVPDFIKMKVTLFSDDTGNEKEFEWIFAPCFGCEPILLKGIKPLPEEDKQKKAGKQLNQLMDDNPLSSSVQDKFNKTFSQSKTTGGPVSGGMQ